MLYTLHMMNERPNAEDVYEMLVRTVFDAVAATASL